jgi:serine/threonine-protein kinase HipA
VVYGDKTLALTLGGKRSGISRKHFLAWATGLGLPERTAVQAVDLALKAAGPLLADLEAGTAFAATAAGSRAASVPTAAVSTVTVATVSVSTDDGGASPFPDMVTRAWVKELKHRRRLLEG